MNLLQSNDFLGKLQNVIIKILDTIFLLDSNLYKSIEVSVDANNNLYIKLPEYSTFVDAGRKSGKMPPYNDILDWVNKNITKRKEGRRDSKNSINNDSNSTEITNESIAWAITKSIANRGLKARPFIDKLKAEIADLYILEINNNTYKLSKNIILSK